MNLAMLSSPFIISLATGYLLFLYLFQKEEKPSFSLQLLLSAGLGLGISSSITFLSFLLLNSFQRPFVLAFHFLLLFWFGLHSFSVIKNVARPSPDLKKISVFSILLLAMIPIWFEAKFYPMGGWDAWQVWNYKAKFLFLAGENWRNLFAPFLWDSSPHYPLLLPLINVWGWIFSKIPSTLTPMLTALIFIFLTASLLYAGLYDLTKNHFVVIAPLLMLTLPFDTIVATASNQYGDIVLSYYLLASLFCFVKTLKRKSATYIRLSGIFLGFLSFTKPEGAVAAAIITFLILAILWLDKNFSRQERFGLTIRFLLALVISGLATIIFQLFLSPGNQTYINGFISAQKPVSFYRLEIIPVYFWMEIKGLKWDGLWLLILAGIFLNFRRIFRREIAILPLTLVSYLTVILFYYYLNTFFKIEWWLQVTLDRILFSLLPIALFWIFYGLRRGENQKSR